MKKRLILCPECDEQVRNLGRHRRRHHATGHPYAPPTRRETASGNATPPTSPAASSSRCHSRDAPLSTPQRSPREPRADRGSGTPWTPPEWWGQPAPIADLGREQQPPDDDWLLEPQCSIGLPIPVDCGPAAEQARHQQTADLPAGQAGIAIQDNCDPAAEQAVDHPEVGTGVTAGQADTLAPEIPPSTPLTAPRLQQVKISPPKARLRIVNPLREVPNGLSDVSIRDLEFASTSATSTTRRMCECVSCVAHAIRLFDVLLTSDEPPTPGLRFVKLPGLCLPAAKGHDPRRLLQLIDRHPSQATVVCGCVSCALHRNLCKAWLQARQIATPRGGKLSRP